jgi:hypothetical protein
MCQPRHFENGFRARSNFVSIKPRALGPLGICEYLTGEIFQCWAGVCSLT